MVQNLKDIGRNAAFAARSSPQPLHMIRSTDLQEQYLQQMHDNLNFEPVSSRTRRRTANAPPPAGAEIVNLNTPVAAPLAPVTTTHDLISPEPNVFAYQSPTSGITYTEFDMRGNPANRSRIVLTENISAIDIQHEQHRIDKRKWRDQCPIGIDQRLYPEYADLPEPYKPFCHYMHKHHFTVPADWQDRDCPPGYLPLLPDLPNSILGPGPRTTPRLREPMMYSQLDECDRYCRHPSWPSSLVIAVLDRNTCRGCIFKYPHYHLENCDDRHLYFHLSPEEQALRLVTPEFRAPQSSSSTSTTAALPRTLNTRMTAAYTNQPAGPVTPKPTSSTAPVVPPVHIKTERLNMIRGSVPLDAPLPSVHRRVPTPTTTPVPEPLTSPIHMTITKFCRDHHLNTRLQYLPHIDICNREPPNILAERLLGCLAAVIDQEIGPFDTPSSPSYLIPLHAEMLDRNLIVAAESIHGDHDSDIPDLIHMQSGLRAFSHRPSAMPGPYRSAEEYAHRATWSRHYIEENKADSAGLVFNTVDQHYYRQIIYGGNAVPRSDYRPVQELLQAVLHDTADRQLAACRLHSIDYPGTHIVASLLPDSPARFFGQPLTDISMLQVYQEHHDLEFELLDKAKSEEELRESIYYNKVYTQNVSTMLNVRKVQDRLHRDRLRRPDLPLATTDIYQYAGPVDDELGTPPPPPPPLQS